MTTEAKTQTNANEKYAQFTGTGNYYKHMLGNLLTDGAMKMATDEQCFWLMDIVASYSMDKKLRNEDFQVWTLSRVKDDKFRVTCDDGNNNVLIIQKIPFSDFPFDTVKLYKVQNVIMLPSEY